MSSQSNNFDFAAFNSITNFKPAGLQLFLAIDLVAKALWQLDKFDNPRAEEMRGCLDELKLLRAGMKQDAADRAKAR